MEFFDISVVEKCSVDGLLHSSDLGSRDHSGSPSTSVLMDVHSLKHRKCCDIVKLQQKSRHAFRKIKRRASRSQKAFIAFSFSLKRTMEIQLQQHYSPLYLQLVLQLQEVSLHRLKLPQTQPTVSAFAATLAQAAKVSPGAPAAAVATPVAAASTPIPAK
uniref:Oxidoreductase-like domain-containing protein n=1 Tax=Parascaris univalens TaxID=6257 RepID=A0A915A0J8_PARUN